MKRSALLLVLLLPAAAFGAVTIGGPIGPDGKTQVTCDLPVDQRTKNTAGKGGRGGLCVFTSIMHDARYQNVRDLFNFQSQVRNDVSGGYPGNVDQEIKRYAPNVQYIQYEGNDPSILALALKTGRMPGVTWDGYHDPHYHGQKIAHMVSMVAYDQATGLVCLLDNNFIGGNELVWMTTQDFLQGWTGGQSGWTVILLGPPPPPPPHN